MTQKIEKQIEIAAPVSKVWKALTDSKQFGEWFDVKVEGSFIAGKTAKGKTLYPGMEHVEFKIEIKKIEPETYFSYSWHPFNVEKGRDYSKEEQTLVEFRLEPITKGTLLVVTESGFDKIPAGRREEAFKMNSGGWMEQLKNIAAYVTKNQ